MARRGRGAVRERIDWLKALHRAGVLTFLGTTRPPNTLYTVSVGGAIRSLPARDVRPYCLAAVDSYEAHHGAQPHLRVALDDTTVTAAQTQTWEKPAGGGVAVLAIPRQA